MASKRRSGDRSKRRYSTSKGGWGMTLLLLVAMWLVFGVDQVFYGGGLFSYGIQPRTLGGLWGILVAPFLHQDFKHLTANSIPFLILGALVALRGRRELLEVSVVISVVSGSIVWLIGKENSVHAGASGLVFGFLGFLLARGFFERSLIAIALSVVAGLLYGGLVWGLFRFESGVSWEGHLAGWSAGCVAGWIMSRFGKPYAGSRGD